MVPTVTGVPWARPVSAAAEAAMWPAISVDQARRGSGRAGGSSVVSASDQSSCADVVEGREAGGGVVVDHRLAGQPEGQVAGRGVDHRGAGEELGVFLAAATGFSGRPTARSARCRTDVEHPGPAPISRGQPGDLRRRPGVDAVEDRVHQRRAGARRPAACRGRSPRPPRASIAPRRQTRGSPALRGTGRPCRPTSPPPPGVRPSPAAAPASGAARRPAR